MSLYQIWQDKAQENRTQEAYNEYWKTYFAAETENYRKILKQHDTVLSGKLSELAASFDMEPYVFVGFLDGINSSLADGEIDLDSLDENSEIALKVDFDKLYMNMHRAKADWLYNLPEWKDVRTEEERKALTKEFCKSQIFVAAPTVGRNDPCPCGSGKKYKKCCGR